MTQHRRYEQNRYSKNRLPDPARLLAVETLENIEAKGQFANLVLPRVLKQKQVEDPHFRFRDAAFVSELVYGTIRNRGYLDFLLEYLSSRPLASLDPLVRQCLRIGAYQVLFMRVPDHAAVSETVNVARKLCGEAPTKMINGVLRALLRQNEQEREQLFATITAPLNRYAAKYSHPKWMVKAFEQALVERGLPAGELPEVLAANNRNPLVTLVARPTLMERIDLVDEVEDVLGQGTSLGELSPYAVILEGGDPGALTSLREGRTAVQDEGSQLAAILLAAWQFPDSEPDSRWADICAGPGGKSALLAALGKPRGAWVDACEIVPKRAELVRISTRALDNVTVTCQDGRDFGNPQTYDRVLIDAPCLGLGSLRRRPESRWRHQETDLDELVTLQRQLFDHGVEITRPGGVIAWVTCSPHVKETLEQVKRQIDIHGLRLLDAATLAQSFSAQPLQFDCLNRETIPTMNWEIVQKTVQLWPHRHNTDAMFIALLQKSNKTGAS